MRLRILRPGTQEERQRSPVADRHRVRATSIRFGSKDPDPQLLEIALLADRFGSPLALGNEESDVQSVGGTGLAARVRQLVPRCDWEPLYEEGVR